MCAGCGPPLQVSAASRTVLRWSGPYPYLWQVVESTPGGVPLGPARWLSLACLTCRNIIGRLGGLYSNSVPRQAACLSQELRCEPSGDHRDDAVPRRASLATKNGHSVHPAHYSQGWRRYRTPTLLSFHHNALNKLLNSKSVVRATNNDSNSF